MATTALESHHGKLRVFAGQLLAMTKQPDLARNSGAAREVLNKMAGTLSVHLAAEDQSFYPRLIADKRREVSDVAKRFQQEMGGLKETFALHLKQWTGDAISANAPAFARETTQLLQTIGARMDREERDLYPLDKA